jgi:hypothetical protein
LKTLDLMKLKLPPIWRDIGWAPVKVKGLRAGNRKAAGYAPAAQ